MTEDLDYGEDVVTTEGDNSMTQLRALARAQKEAELEVERCTAALETAKDNLRDIAEKLLPELMDELGIPSFKTTDGLRITIKEVVRTSIGRTEEEKGKAIDWLESNGHGSLVKRIVEIPFRRGQDELALDLSSELRQRGMSPQFERKVENSTLRAFVTEMLESGRDIPLDLFKVVRDRRSKVEL